MITFGAHIPFPKLVHRIRALLIDAPVVDTGEWQAIVNSDIPQSRTLELEDVSFKFNIPNTIEELRESVKPNLPWADLHFAERISGIPYNPPPSHVHWPFAVNGNDAHRSDEKFSHTYPERMWPKYKGQGDELEHRMGIRFPYGDLSDVVRLLQNRPMTRQAYLPIWFPEDTGAVQGQRVPCTIGYHFMIRDDQLKCVYYIRSCDFIRHFRDDVYLASRLTQGIAAVLRVTPGQLVMHISSLHVFEADRRRLVSAQALELKQDGQ